MAFGGLRELTETPRNRLLRARHAWPSLSADLVGALLLLLSGMQDTSIPQVGQLAPDFTLPDSNCHLLRLGELVAQGPLVLIFFRGHW